MNLTPVAKLIIFYIVYTLSSNQTNGAKILSVFGLPGPSQYIIALSLLKGLAEKGHQVTSISTFPQKAAVKNFRDVAVMENSKLLEGLLTEAIVKAEENSYFREWLSYSDIGCQMVSNVLENPQVKELMENEKFDLIIVEAMLGEALYGLGQHFNAPMVGVTAFGTLNFVDMLVGNISPTSYIPHMSLPFSDSMSLKERLHNVVANIMDDLSFYYVLLPRQEKLFNKYFPNSKITFKEALTNFSLVLINQHFTLSHPRPFVPNMIEVGGLHINEKPDPLPLDIQQFLDNATEGAIYFSMGSNLKSKDLPKKTLNMFLDAFRELNLKVLWKFEAESLPNKPSNVFIKAWYPQQSILAHPNVKLFISHGGFLSTTEAIYHGKPILGIPVLGDQPRNIRQAVQKGFALSLDLNNITKSLFIAKIKELLTNDSYTKKVQQLSKRFRDQPQKPLEKAVYWIEYVLRHEGSPHLRNGGVTLSYWQLYNIDVYAILIAGFLFLIYILVSVRGIVKKLLCRRKELKKLNGGYKIKNH